MPDIEHEPPRLAANGPDNSSDSAIASRAKAIAHGTDSQLIDALGMQSLTKSEILFARFVAKQIVKG